MRYVSRVQKTQRVLAKALFAAVVFTLTACGGQPTEDVLTSPSTTSFKLQPANPSAVYSGTVNFSGVNGTPPYVFAVVSGGGSISASGVFTAPTSAGSVVVGILDSTGKAASTTVTVVGPVNIAPSTWNMVASGTKSFAAAGGKTPYTYSVTSGGGSINSSGLYTAPAAAGSATIQVTDALGQTASASITIFPALTISPASIAIAINDIYTFTTSGGVGGSTFSVVSGGGTIDPSTGDFTAPASASTVVVRVTDSGGNTADATVNVIGPLSITPSSWAMAVDNIKSFTGVGGQAPYTYSVFSGGGSINSATGSYTAPSIADSAVVRVTDAFGQTADAAVTINPALAISPAAVTLQPSDTQTFSATGGVGSYTYAVVSGGGSINASTGAFTAPASAGTVIVKVTDSIGNISNATVTVQLGLSISPVTFTLAVDNNKTFLANGGTAPYTFSVLSGGGSINSSTGAYTAPSTPGSAVVRVTDNVGATADSNVTINPAIAISPTALNMLTNGSQTFTATGGVTPYTFSVLSGGGSINSSTGAYTAPAAPATVVVRVTDVLGNHADSNVNVVLPLVITPSTWSLVINDTKTFTASGGEAPYVFSILSGSGSVDPSTGDFTAPATPGTTVVRLTDNLGSHADAAVTINPPLSISPTTITVALSATQTFTAAGGVSPYTYSIVSGGGSINSTTGVYTAPASVDIAVIRVTDSRGNTADANIAINDPLVISPSTFTLAVNNVRTFPASGGVAPYTFSVFAGTGSIDSSTGVYTAPAASGSATVRVTDSVGNTADATVTINPALAIAPASITVALNGSQTFSATGGVTPYTFSVVSGVGSINSSTGAYSGGAVVGSAVVRVTDALGNTSDAAVNVNDPLVISPTSWALAVTNTKTFSASGGVAPYTFSVFSGGGTINSSSGLYTAPGSSGSATVRVTDSNGNTADAAVTINPALAISPASVNLGFNSTQTFTSTGGVSPYTYSVVSGGGSINSSTGLFTANASTGTTTVRVTDALGNISNATVNIANTLTISPTSWTLAVNNTKTFVGAGGTTPYTFSKQSGTGSINASTGVYTAPASSGSAVVKVTDNLGQTATATITINAALQISPATKALVTNGSQTFSATGGVAPYTYSVFAGGGSIVPATGAYTAPATAGSATIRVTDSLGNISNAAVTILDPLVISPVSINLLSDDTTTFTASGGDGNYTFSIFSGGGSVDPATGDFTAPSAPESIVVRVIDGAGLTADANVEIYDPLVIAPTTVTLAPTNTQTFTTTGGLGAITFSIVSGSGTIDPNTGDYEAPASAGTDVIRATDSIGNTADATITINGALTITPTTKKISINETFTFVATNGVAPRTFSVESGGGSIDPNTGVFTAPGSSQTVTVRVTDALDNTADATVTIITPVKIWSGGYNNCVKYDDNSLKCWGDGANGKLGTGATADLGDAATEMGTALGFMNLGTGRYPKDMALGDNHMCAILDDDSLKCWGANSSGQLGLGNTSARGDNANEMGDNLPVVDVGTGRTVKKVAVGPTNTCAILDDDSLKCWGANTYGQLGKGNTITLGDGAGEMGDSLTAINLGTGRYATQVIVGTSHACALLDNATVKCWGRSNRGQLGQGNTTSLGDGAGEMGDSLPTVSLSSTLTVVAIAGGSESTCAKMSDSSVKCWGRNNAGQLGQGNTTTRGDSASEMGDTLAFSSLGTGLTATGLFAATQNVCVLTNTGVLKCWGLGTYGELGKGNTSTLGDGGSEMGDNLTAIDTGGDTISQVSMGIYHVCIMNTSAQVKCWGRATNGALGSGSSTAHKGDGANEMSTFLPRVKL